MESSVEPEILRAPGWTPHEIFACAFCWAEFSRPEDRTDTPEQYWLRLTEQKHNMYRGIAKRLRLLSVARYNSAPVPIDGYLEEGEFEKLKDALRMKADHRVRAILKAVANAFLRKPN